MRITKRYIRGIAFFIIAFALFKYLAGEKILVLKTGKELVSIVLIFLLSAELTDKYKAKHTGRRFSYNAAPVIKSLFAKAVLIILSERLSLIGAGTAAAAIVSFFASDLMELALIAYGMDNNGRYLGYKVSGNNSVKPAQEIREDTVRISKRSNVLSDEYSRIYTTLLKGVKPINRGGISGANKEPIFSSIAMNDFRDINRRLADYNALIGQDGLIILKYNPLNKTYRKIIAEHNPAAALFLFTWFFIYRIIFPQLPFVNRIYSKHSRGKLLSRAEAWGRIHYSGFEVLNELNEKEFTYVLARKQTEPLINSRPSFYSFVALNRVGYEGRLFPAYKIRTMYPYSEFIQQKVFEMNKLEVGGKINNDFRITPAGRVMRKYWLDELPQLFNWLKSDIKLVGIKGMSPHYFSLYPDYYKEKFIKVKPGLIPPIFSRNSDDFNSIVNKELGYLDSYLAKPFATDLKYFFATLNKIVFKGFRGR